MADGYLNLCYILQIASYVYPGKATINGVQIMIMHDTNMTIIYFCILSFLSLIYVGIIDRL